MQTLNELIRAEVTAAGSNVDYDTIADRVAAAIPPDDTEPILRALIRPYIHQLVRSDRRRVEDEMLSELAEPVTPLGHEPAPSRRAQCVPAYKRWLDEQIIVDAVGKPKRVGEITAEDCRIIARKRSVAAAELMAKAKWWEAVAQALDAAKVRTLDELPPATLDAVFRTRKEVV